MDRALRFSVLERDNFACQYCGRRAPDVVLEIDHVTPKSQGGKDKLDNLVTACFDCNRGKRARILAWNEPFVSCADCSLLYITPQDEPIEVFQGGPAWICPPCWEDLKESERIPCG